MFLNFIFPPTIQSLYFPSSNLIFQKVFAVRIRDAIVMVGSLGLLVAGPAWPAQAQDTGASPGAGLYRNICADCHGRRGELQALGQSRPLRTLDGETVRETLLARRADPHTMQDRIKAGLTDDEVDALAAYVDAFSSP